MESVLHNTISKRPDSESLPPPAEGGVLRRHGAAAVEFALILPLLVLVLLGIVDFGRFAYSYIAVTNASREGAAFGSVNPFTDGTQNNWESQVRQRVLEELQPIIGSDAPSAADLVVTATRTTDPDGLWRVRIEVAYPFEMIVPWPALPNQMTLRRTVEMRGIR